MSNEYVVLSFRSLCKWEWQDDDDNESDGDEGGDDGGNIGGGRPSRKERRLADKVRAGIRKRNNNIYTERQEQQKIANALAERIALRLLEDVTVDACVREGDDELLGDLTISDSNDGDDRRHEPRHGKKARRG